MSGAIIFQTPLSHPLLRKEREGLGCVNKCGATWGSPTYDELLLIVFVRENVITANANAPNIEKTQYEGLPAIPTVCL